MYTTLAKPIKSLELRYPIEVGLRRSGLTMSSSLVVCLAGAPASVAAEVDAGVTVSVAEAASVLCL